VCSTPFDAIVLDIMLPGRDGRIPTEFNAPPSLRLGLLETAKRIGGDAGVQVLTEVLKVTGRGAEVAYTAYALEELVPGQYREAALAAARELLSHPAGASSTGDWTSSIATTSSRC
jgi:CheY-like chemotaxis protein